MHMQIEEAQRLKNDTEQQVAELLMRFERDTGTYITEINLNSMDYMWGSSGRMIDVELVVRLR